MVLYFDTETTSLTPGKICQLSYIMQNGREEKGKNFFFTVPKVDYGAYIVHGFSAEKLKVLSNGKTFADFIDEIEKDFSLADVIVAHNFSFDYMFLSAEFNCLNRTFTYNESFCSMKKSTPVCKIPRKSGVGYKYPKLNELCDYFGISSLSVCDKTEKLFLTDANYHDARFDTVAMYLAINRGIDHNLYEELHKYI
ncbi:MAG: 3'-5' exonuclease [Clostridia bacterium]|nr:3'-5' exonuclease [Clostridia bacterium]